MSNLSFAQLKGFVEYKEKLAGVPIVTVDPWKMSGACMEYERFNKGNRLVRGIFLRRRCGHFDHADILGATNIAFAAQVAAREVSAAASAA